jgi:gluconate kinase
MARNAIGIPLDDDDRPAILDGIASVRQAVQDAALVKND